MLASLLHHCSDRSHGLFFIFLCHLLSLPVCCCYGTPSQTGCCTHILQYLQMMGISKAHVWCCSICIHCTGMLLYFWEICVITISLLSFIVSSTAFCTLCTCYFLSFLASVNPFIISVIISSSLILLMKCSFSLLSLFMFRHLL